APVQPNRAVRRRAQHDRKKIEEGLDRYCPAGDVIEVRALNSGPRGNVTSAGYFDSTHRQEAAPQIGEISASGIYVTSNPVKSGLLARAANRLQTNPKSLTKDGEIDRRVGLFIDIDSVRLSDISATDEEKRRAFERAEECRRFLAERGWVP